MSRLLLLLALLFGPGGAALAETRVVVSTSDPVIGIDSAFRGETLTIFGNIETDAPPLTRGDPYLRPYQVIVLVEGPPADIVVREKGRRLGMVLTTGQALYQDLPGYYAILSSAPPDRILGDEVLSRPGMSFAGLAALSRSEGGGAEFDPELIRLMQAGGFFVGGERAVTFLSPTAFAVRVPLSSNVPNGPFLARVLVIAQSRVVAQGGALFTVRTQGTERFIANAAVRHPLLYGLAAVVIALATGWLGGVLFRR